MERDPKREQDQRIAELAKFSEEVGGDTGRLLHLLHLELLRPGAGVWFQQQQADGEEEPIPPWPEEGEEDPLEEPFGDDADRIRLITEEELEELRDGGDPAGVEPEPDHTRPGDLGSPRPVTPTPDWGSRIVYHDSDGKWSRIGSNELPACGQLWILDFRHYWSVPACAGVNYDRMYRATLLRAYAEAFRLCRERDEDCPDARVWMLRALWNCYRSQLGTFAYVHFKFAIACVAG
jgi:hypothetical protein